MKKIVSLNSSHNDSTLVGGPSTGSRIIPKHPFTHLKKARDINLSGCTNITDAGVKHLKEATSIDLKYCTQITHEGVTRFKILNPTCEISG